MLSAVDTVQGGKDLELKSARVEMFKGSMRLSIPESGSIQQLSSSLTIKPKVSRGLSGHTRCSLTHAAPLLCCFLIHHVDRPSPTAATVMSGHDL